MKTIYFNIKGPCGVETVDELRQEYFNSFKEFKKEVRNMLTNYWEAGMSVYTSQRCTKEWAK